MRIESLQVLTIPLPQGSEVSRQGEFLVTPMHIFEDYRRILGEGFVGLRGGPIGAIVVRLITDDGLEGFGTVGVGNGSALYILEHSLKPIVVGAKPFDVEVLWEPLYSSHRYFGAQETCH